MIDKVECVMIACDNCKESYQNEDSGFSIFADEGTAIEDASEGGWYMFADNGKHYCRECHMIENDDVFIKTLPVPEEGSGDFKWRFLQEN